MTPEGETPGAADTATEAEVEAGPAPLIRPNWTITDATDPLCIQWAEAACLALAECREQDRAAICAAILDAMQTEGPRHDAYNLLYQDARWWADMAPPHELVAYGTAALDRLRGHALSIPARKRLFARLWETFDPKDRQAFLARVDAEGRFLRRGAA